jgi:hypothetical protein
MSEPIEAKPIEHHIRCGDSVKVDFGQDGEHRRTETLLVAYADHLRDRLSWWGWPFGTVEISKVELVKACTDEEHAKCVAEWCDKPDRASSEDRGWDDRRSTVMRLHRPQQWLEEKIALQAKLIDEAEKNLARLTLEQERDIVAARDVNTAYASYLDTRAIQLLTQIIDHDSPPGMAANQLARTIVAGLRSIEGDAKVAALTVNPIADAFVNTQMMLTVAGPVAAGQSEEVWGFAESEDDERWSGMCGSREEAIAEARSELGLASDQDFYIIRGRKPAAADFVPDVDWILEHMGDQAGDQIGEIAEEFPDVTDEGRAALTRYLEAWARKYAEPVNFWAADGKAERIEPVQPTTETVGGTE